MRRTATSLKLPVNFRPAKPDLPAPEHEGRRLSKPICSSDGCSKLGLVLRFQLAVLPA
jgi:hypothetical protein